MKILYALQGTGNGHLSRAKEIIPTLQRYGQVDILISGTQVDLTLPYEVKYRLKGMSFIFGKKGGVECWKTFKNANLSRFINEARTLPVKHYDLVLNDFEPVSSWACRLRGVPMIALSHQSAVLHSSAPKPVKYDYFGKAILKYYAPATVHFGFHFEKYAADIFTPIIRKEIRDLSPSKDGHYTVYLPAYGDDQIYRRLSRLADIEWEVYSKNTKRGYRRGNIYFSPIHGQQFINSMAASEGVLCGAGFETPAEALFLRKKLIVIPMKTQYEQACNAAALQNMGVPVLKHLNELRLSKIESWLNAKKGLEVNYLDETDKIVQQILNLHSSRSQNLEIISPLDLQQKIEMN